MTDGAAFAQGFMFEHKRPRLFAMTLGAAFIEPRHGQAIGWLEDVAPVRDMALNTIHAALNDRLMLGQVELSLGLQVALKARGGIFAWIHDEFASPAAGFDMLAAGHVAGFATCLAHVSGAFDVHSSVRAGREHPCD